MTKILTVDDSRVIRQIVGKQVREFGFEVDEAEDGEQGLAKLKDCPVDLILLDVSMPVMDGPTMLEKLRELGNRTPVVMLTSETKRSVVAQAMKAGIADYIVKPFKPEELRAKILGALKMGGGPPPAVSASPPPASAPASAAAPMPMMSAPMSAPPSAAAWDGAKQFVDVMVVDDMENVGKRLRTLLPQHVSMNGYTSAQLALGACRERVYRVIVIDTELPEVDSSVLANQLRVLQPHAAFVALCLRSTNDVQAELKDKGFGGILYKPFNQQTVDDFVVQFLNKQDLLTDEDEVLRVAAFTGKEDRLSHYINQLANLFPGALEKLAAACFESAIIDLSHAPAQPELVKLLISVMDKVKALGLRMKLVGNAELRKLLSSFEETKRTPLFNTVAEARADASG